MPLEKLPEDQRTCDNCDNDGTDGPICLSCRRSPVASGVCNRTDAWRESASSLRPRADQHIAELEANAEKMRAAIRNREADNISLAADLDVIIQRAKDAERERDEARAELLHEYEIQQKECLANADADTCDMCGGCHLTERISDLKGGA